MAYHIVLQKHPRQPESFLKSGQDDNSPSGAGQLTGPALRQVVSRNAAEFRGNRIPVQDSLTRSERHCEPCPTLTLATSSGPATAILVAQRRHSSGRIGSFSSWRRSRSLIEHRSGAILICSATMPNSGLSRMRHRRDTFAVELLLAGVPLDQVSLLLGHRSVKITERHHAPFSKARQEQLAASVKLAWKKPDQSLQEISASSSPKRARRQDSASVKKSALRAGQRYRQIRMVARACNLTNLLAIPFSRPLVERVA
jgi:hypothetical protein